MTWSRTGRGGPGYVEAAAGWGLGSVHAFPVRVDQRPVATLTLFGQHRDALTSGGGADAAVFADLAGTVAAHDLDGVFAAALSEDRVFARGPSTDIAVASGILSVRHQLSVDDALARLRAAAYARGVPLTALAAEIVSGQTTLD